MIRPFTLDPFQAEVPEADLEDLRTRLAGARWPERETVDDWSQGVPLDYLREVAEHWRTAHDWRRAERDLNSLDQFVTDIEGHSIHFIHARSPHAEALPIVITHGWPGSVLEFQRVIAPLVDPTQHG
ncbi:MAG: epoxide hydrolase N-terminal domain-containing protein, partial [Ilumatobacteraceae bacterium]